VRIGEVQTRARNVVQGLMPLPSASGQDMESLLLAEPLAMEACRARPSRRPSRSKAANCSNGSRACAGRRTGRAARRTQPVRAEETAADVAAILAEMALEPDCTFQPAAQLFQDFTVRCRMQRLGDTGIDLARSGAVSRWRWPALPTIASRAGRTCCASGATCRRPARPVPGAGRAAAEGTPCPDDDKLAEVYGTRSPGRIRRLLEHLERSGLIVVRTDYGGRRSIGIPELGLTTAPMEA
jgi:hypothetical protein